MFIPSLGEAIKINKVIKNINWIKTIRYNKLHKKKWFFGSEHFFSSFNWVPYNAGCSASVRRLRNLTIHCSMRVTGESSNLRPTLPEKSHWVPDVEGFRTLYSVRDSTINIKVSSPRSPDIATVRLCLILRCKKTMTVCVISGGPSRHSDKYLIVLNKQI